MVASAGAASLLLSAIDRVVVGLSIASVETTELVAVGPTVDSVS